MAFSPKLLQQGAAGVPIIPKNYIEDVFSTFVYTGNASTQTITNGIDLAGKGGLVWIKPRASALSHTLTDTLRGRLSLLVSNTNAAQSIADNGYNIQSFNSDGFTLSPSWQNGTNSAGESNVAWTFRKQPKFFDIVTFVAAASGKNQRVSHSLGSVPGCIMIKPINTGGDWYVYHRSLSGVGASAYQNFLSLSSTAAASSSANTDRYWGSANPTSTDFGLSDELLYGGGTEASRTYIAYVFAHDAGGFGLTGNDNVISCGSFTANTNTTVNLGWEPQWILFKNANGAFNWAVVDAMRGWTTDGNFNVVKPNTSDAESGESNVVKLTSTGFQWVPAVSGNTYIYIAIRRGPMKVPTSGTSVFSPEVQTPTAGANNNMAANSGFPIDWLPTRQRNNTVDWYQTSRLTENYMSPNQPYEEGTYDYGFDRMSGVGGGPSGWSATSTISYAFRRAPGFFDVVCYTGTLANLTLAHNLGVAPEMMIVKCRSSPNPGGITANWAVYAAPQGNSKFALLNTTDLFGTSAVLWQATTPTASNFYVGAANYVNGSAEKYVAYLFASVPGVSKVGTYTGTGALLTVDCGFTSGARFVLIKRADTSGDWWLYNSASGISSGNDPYLLVNSQAAEVTGTSYVDTDTTGFKITATAPAGLNANGGTYIFLAIA